MRLIFAALVFSLSFCARENSAFAAEASLPPHPRLLLNAEGVAQLKQRLAQAPWAKAEWYKLKRNADKNLEQPLELPPRGGNWSHNYVCPTHGARLSQGKKIGPWQWEHKCPEGKHILKGDPSKAELDFDGNAIAGIHGDLAELTVDYGLLYQVIGDEKYARKSREILLAYADKYLSYPMHNNSGIKGKGGRVASQSLTEASWLIHIAQGADLVWTKLSEADRQAIATKMLRPALDQIILKSRHGIHNIQCRHNSAIGLVGYLLGDQKLIDRAIDDPQIGYRQQMEKGVLADGMWTEGSSGYHFFTIAGVWPLTEAARNCGLDLYGPKFRSMFDGPITMAMPNFVLPNFNDSGSVALSGEAEYYEIAYARYHNPLYTGLLAKSSRQHRLAMLFGVVEFPPGALQAAAASRNSPASGYAMLQHGDGAQAVWVGLKYGPHGGGHGHPDKNHFILYAHDQVLAPDGGTHAYGSVLHNGWDKSTFAHNTLVMDETSQQSATGSSLAFGSEQGVDYSMTDAGAIYSGVQFIRTVAMVTPQLILVVDQVHAAAPHTFDVVYHQLGKWEGLDAGQPWTPKDVPGYKYISSGSRRELSSDGMTFKTKLSDKWQPAIRVASGEATELIAGYGILKTTEDHVPVLIQRRQTADTAFVWTIGVESPATVLRMGKVNNAQGQPLAASQATLAEVSDGAHTWRVLVNPQKQKISATVAGKPWQTHAPFAVQRD